LEHLDLDRDHLVGVGLVQPCELNHAVDC
jgi:hypothetical protein